MNNQYDNITNNELRNNQLILNDISQQFNEATTIEENSSLQNINEIIDKLKNINISDAREVNSLHKEILEKVNKFKELLLQNTIGLSQVQINEALTKLLEFVTTLNGLKNQLIQLPFNPFNRLYVQNCLQPLLTIQVSLTPASAAYVGTARGQAFSTVVKRKSYKIRKYEKTTYKMMDQSTCVNSVIETRVCNFIGINCG